MHVQLGVFQEETTINWFFTVTPSRPTLLDTQGGRAPQSWCWNSPRTLECGDLATDADAVQRPASLGVKESMIIGVLLDPSCVSLASS